MKQPKTNPGLSQASDPHEVVFLLHGICKSSLDMIFLASALRKEGYEVVNWNYPSRRCTLEELADLLAAKVAPFEGRRLSFVTHSMGGIVVRTYISRYHPKDLGRFVMIAPPNHGAYLADLLGDRTLFKIVFGPAGQQLRQGDKGACLNAGIPPCEFGVIAGGLHKPKGMNPLVPGDNDGTVSVDCTKLDGMADFIVVPYAHTYIQFMPATVRYTVNFLKSGHFSPEFSQVPSGVIAKTQVGDRDSTIPKSAMAAEKRKGRSN